MAIKQNIRTFVLFILLLLFITCLPVTAFTESDVPAKRVRVGWFTLENFMEGGEDDSVKAGFICELLSEIFAYNNWNIEYVYGDFSDLYEMLESREIDLLPNVIDTDERRQNVLFDSYSINEERYYLSAIESDDADDNVSASALNGKRLAQVEGAYEEKYFDEWATKTA